MSQAHVIMIEELRNIVADVLDISPEEVADGSGPSSTDRWDSMNHLRIITAVEDECGVTFTMDEIQSIDSFAALHRLATSKRE